MTATCRGIYAVIAVFIVVGVVNMPDGPFKRPHPCECNTADHAVLCGVLYVRDCVSIYVCGGRRGDRWLCITMWSVERCA